MKSSLQKMFEKLELLYENTYNLLKAFQQASVSSSQVIEVPQRDEKGNITYVKVNSFQQLQNELTRIDNNFKQITNADNISYVLNGDGSISQMMKTSFMNAEYLENFTVNPSALIDRTSVIENLVFPNVKIPVTIDSVVRSDIHAFVYQVTYGWDSIPDDITLVGLKYLISEGDVIAESHEHVLKLEKEQIKYFGKFTVTAVETQDSNTFIVNLNGIKYQSINSISNSIDLKIGDILVTKAGSGKFQITDINQFENKLTLLRIGGIDSPQVGIDNLFFNEILPSDKHVVGIPVRPAQKLIVFLSTENIKNISYPSIGLKFDTSIYEVNYNDETYTLDEFFSNYVTNFGEYLNALITETSIPANLGITPKTPSLAASNFKVIQINKHLTSAKNTEELNRLNEEKQKIKNDIEAKNTTIANLQNELNTLKYKTAEEKNNKIERVKSLQGQVATLNSNLLVVSRNLDDNAVTFGLKDFKPKYRIIGFWDIQEPIISPVTKPQQIIKYDVQYRYLSTATDVVDSTSVKMLSNGKEINVVFSSWVDLPTKTLDKIENNAGEKVWQSVTNDNVNDININQCLISIKSGESVEIRVRAVSEAGYPIAPLKSEWSDIIRIDFPDELADESVTSVVQRNETDLQSAQFNQILQSTGILDHVNSRIKESEKTYWHNALEIASGFYSEELKNISLFEYLTRLRNDIDSLMNLNAQETVSVELVDFANNAYTIKNGITMELFAGNYADNLNLLDDKTFGTIVKKQAYIKLKNKSTTTPMELKTLVPGDVFNATNAKLYYNVPVKTVENFVQKQRQVIYFRNIDITMQEQNAFLLVKPKTEYPNMSVDVPSQFLDSGASEVKKDILYCKNISGGATIHTGKLTDNHPTDQFNVFTKEHPLYDPDNITPMIDEFKRLQEYTKILSESQCQMAASINDEVGRCGFSDNDVYAVGKYSCGAFLYPIIANLSAIQVVGNSSVSTLIIPPETEILIPVVFEYRMLDRKGYVNGEMERSISDSLQYSKKIGIDMLINNNTFRFDINVSAKLKSKIAPIDSQNVSSIITAYRDENKETIM